MTAGGTIRVIGIGNRWRGDDAVGLLAAQRIRARLDPAIEVIETEGDGLTVLDLMEGADQVMLIDAVQGGARSGEIIRLDLSTHSRWDSVVPCSTHAWGLAEAIDLARALGRLPGRVILYGLTIESIEPGASLSHAANAGLDNVIEQLIGEVERVSCTKCI